MATPNTIQKIQKLVNGNVQLLNKFDVVLGVLSSNTLIRRNEAKNGFILTDNISGAQSFLWVENLLYYIIDPAPQVAYLANIWDWWLLLRRYFFPIVKPYAVSDEIINGSDVVAGQTVTDALNNLSAGIGSTAITAASGAYSILTTDRDIYCTADNSTFTLPAIGLVFGQEYRIWVRNYTGFTLACDSGAGDRILGEITQNLPPYSMVTVRCFVANEWLIGN